MRTKKNEYKKYSKDEERQLLASLAEQLRVPIVQMARLSEEDSKKNRKTIAAISRTANELIDAYQLVLQLHMQEGALHVEPVSLSALLHKTAQKTQRLAEEYRCDVQIDTKGSYEPVLINTEIIEAALSALSSVFIIESKVFGADTARSSRPIVTLAAHRSRWGLVVGAYSSNTSMNNATYGRAKNLYGKARQPFNHIFTSAGAGVFIANALLAMAACNLHASRYHNMTGLAVTLKPASQLSLV
ncbi:MAG TPA: hypothetical protein PKA02_01475 [Candidatus Saccharibacteria bacterium]|nr:hypothetical protein [Candidatus Saccharibacteria bacterium]